MDQNCIPAVFRQLLSIGNIGESDIFSTRDGFCFLYKSLSNILLEKDIIDFPDSDGNMLSCSKFYDDWFLYAVPNNSDYTYSLFKLREQEYDAKEASPADGDTPGVTVSFISFGCEKLLDCLAAPTVENRYKLDNEINRVVARRGQRHHNALKAYFSNPLTEGSYLIAATYVKHIAAFAVDGYLYVPDKYRQIAEQFASGKKSESVARLPRFVEALNQKAGCVICDHEKIYIKNHQEPNEYEAAAILATHTGNTSVYSFAAEVEYHARFLTSFARIKIPFLGRSPYDSAIRADMSVGDTELQGPAPFYRSESKIVTRQFALHPK